MLIYVVEQGDGWNPDTRHGVFSSIETAQARVNKQIEVEKEKITSVTDYPAHDMQHGTGTIHVRWSRMIRTRYGNPYHIEEVMLDE